MHFANVWQNGRSATPWKPEQNAWEWVQDEPSREKRDEREKFTCMEAGSGI
jgi:hypothetical protein